MDDQPQPVFSYDRVAYPSPVLESLTPDRLRASALLHGYNPPEATTASVLEIGCGDGVGLVAWASTAPTARIVGFDLSPIAVAKGKELAEAAGFTNVDLHVGDILTYPRDGEKFDYIVCHGVLSWVPEPVRAALLDLIAAKLAPGGIAYVSFDCLPGAAQKAALVPFLRSRVAETDDPMVAMKEAATVIDMINRSLRPDSKMRDHIDFVMQIMLNTKAGYFYHDWLAEHYRPIDLRQLIADSAAHGLKIAGSAANYDLDVPDLDDEAKAMLDSFGDDHGARLLAIDLLRGPSIFHRELFVRTDAPPPPVTDGYKAVTYGFEGSREDTQTEAGPVTRYFLSDTFSVTINTARSRAVLDLLYLNQPAEFTYDEILEHTKVDPDWLRSTLFELCRNNFIVTRSTPAPFTLEPGERPVAAPLVRAMADRGERIIAHRSADVEADKLETRLLFALSDGTRTRTEIAVAMSELLGRDVPLAMVEGAVAHYARRRMFSA